MKPPILVLEDMSERVEWLRARAQGHPVVWAQTVTEFLALPQWDGPIALVVLDHDLDLAHGGKPKVNVGPGPDGCTGMHAVERMPWVGCPVLVWSANEAWAPIMAARLLSREITAFRQPFDHHFLGLTVSSFVRRWEAWQR